jgi:hypothetical protein
MDDDDDADGDDGDEVRRCEQCPEGNDTADDVAAAEGISTSPAMAAEIVIGGGAGRMACCEGTDKTAGASALISTSPGMAAEIVIGGGAGSTICSGDDVIAGCEV